MLPRLFQESGRPRHRGHGHPRAPGQGSGRQHRAQHEPLQAHPRRHPRRSGPASTASSARGLASSAPPSRPIERDLSVSEIGADAAQRQQRRPPRGCEALGWRGGAAPAQPRRAASRAASASSDARTTPSRTRSRCSCRRPSRPAARVYADVQGRAIVHDGTRVTGVHGVALDSERASRTRRVDVRARVVVLAASAVGSAALARRSGLPDPHDQLGRGLRMHPGGVVAGRFDGAIEGWRGIPQSYECTEHLSHEEGSDRRVWIVPAFAHPIGAAAMLPGFGAAHMAAMRAYPNLAVLTAMVHDETERRGLRRRRRPPRPPLRDDRARPRAARQGPRRLRAPPARRRRPSR